MRGDLTGQRIDHMTVLKKVEKEGTHWKYLCRCDCGKEWIVNATNIRRTNGCRECSHKPEYRNFEAQKVFRVPDCGKRLLDVVFAKDIKLKNIAEVTGVSKSTIWSFLYDGADISCKRLTKICAYCGVSMDYVMGLKKEA